MRLQVFSKTHGQLQIPLHRRKQIILISEEIAEWFLTL